MVFWVIRKERNSRAFEGKVSSLYSIRDKWMQSFGIILFGHDIISDEDFGNVIDILTFM